MLVKGATDGTEPLHQSGGMTNNEANFNGNAHDTNMLQKCMFEIANISLGTMR